MEEFDQQEYKLYCDVCAEMHNRGYYAVTPAVVATVDLSIQQGTEPTSLSAKAISISILDLRLKGAAVDAHSDV